MEFLANGGAILGRENGTASSSVQRKFTSYMKEPETALTAQLNYAVFREHSVRIGRFYMADPLQRRRSPQSLNRYSYGRNDPINRWDRAGLQDSDDEPPRTDGEGGGGGGFDFGGEFSEDFGFDPTGGGGSGGGDSFGLGCDPTIDPNCGGGGGGPFGCDPTTDPTCGIGNGLFGCDPTIDPTCGGGGLGRGCIPERRCQLNAEGYFAWCLGFCVFTGPDYPFCAGVCIAGYLLQLARCPCA